MSESVASQFRAIVAEREHQIRESWVKAMELRITRDVLNQCQKAEGVNNFENCKEVADRYTSMLADSKVKGYRKIDVAS
ncbi:uncharacterized protein EI90DRAFT_3117503 [Cantharellus anzutake]|uniref:uncharacterized protein n=1 Tax=Cantharellus anzutake TaxID=1750568 RepID=UPI00190538CB|nr:uncharacterized protein EI90DRAFT_3117503 [Cantharellus anzutake]KAF8339716.1 hypothetical protein EI90DRAFT_3117503 [Cantharellus anzutake]